jgi:hypothetical protein
MKFMECRATRREIDQTEVGEPLSAQTLRHVASCASCGAFQNDRARLRELLTGLEPVTAPADFDFRLRARIAAQAESVGPRASFASFVLSTPAIAVATVVVIALGLSILWMSQRTANQPTTAATNSSQRAGEGNSKAGDQPSPPINQPGVTSSTEGTSATGAKNPDAPIYLVRSGKPQFKGPGSTQPIRSSQDLSEGSAPSIKQGENATDVSVSAPLNPMVLSFQDDKGATRTVSLPPVSFGSQRLLESRAVPVSLKNGNGRVW